MMLGRAAPPTTQLWAWLRNHWRGMVLPAFVALLMLYSADQLLTGERGLVTWRVMQSQIADLRRDIAQLEADSARLNTNIDRLKGAPLEGGKRSPPDSDFIDELLRQNLGVLKAGEAVILREGVN